MFHRHFPAACKDNFVTTSFLKVLMTDHENDMFRNLIISILRQNYISNRVDILHGYSQYYKVILNYKILRTIAWVVVRYVCHLIVVLITMKQ